MRQAIHFPVWIACNVRIRSMYKGCIVLNPNVVKLGLIRIGYHKVEAIDIYSKHTIIDINKNGKVVFKGDAHIGHGAIISVKANARLNLGENFAISGTTSIICYKNISIGDNVQFSWDSLVIDSDAHHIINEDGLSNENTIPIFIGNKVWIGARTTILKGTHVKNNCVIGAASLLNRKYDASNTLIAGCPAKEIKKISNWEL